VSKSVVFTSCSRIACAGQSNPTVILCLSDASLLVSGRTTFEGVLTNVYRSGNDCNTPSWRYVVSYDEALLTTPTIALTAEDVTGIFCKSCLTTWVEDEVSTAGGECECDDCSYSASLYGGTTQAAIEAALVAIGTIEARLYIGCGTWAITSNLTIPDNITLSVSPGALFVISGGITLAIEGTLVAPIAQIFSGAGDVTFALKTVTQVLPEWFGAIPDGVIDCTDAINAALTSISAVGGLVYFSSGEYVISDQLVGYSKVSLKGTGPGSIIKSNFPLASGKFMLTLEGTLSTSTTLTADTTIGSRTLTVTSTTGFVAGEYIYIVQSDNWAMLHRVKSVDSPTQLTLHEVVGFDWLNGDTVQRGEWVRDVTVSDLNFIGTEIASERTADRYEDHAINCRRAHHIEVSSCSFLNIGSRAIIFIDLVSESLALNNRVVKCYDRAIESHHSTSGNVISGNVILGGLVGVLVHGIGTACVGNTCKGQYGYDAGGTLRGSGIGAGDLFMGTISGNTVDGSEREGMSIGSNVNETVISGNTIAFSKRDGMTVYGNYINIIGNSFFQNGTVVEDACISLLTTTGVNIDGNLFHAPTGVTTRAIYSSTPQTNIIIGSNTYISFPGAITNIDSGSTYIGMRIGEGDPMRKVFIGTATWDPAIVAPGNAVYTDVTVTGARLGDTVTVGFTTQIPSPECILTGTVLSNDTVRVLIRNFDTVTSFDLASGTVRADCWRS
jgi:hypothetical protein